MKLVEQPEPQAAINDVVVQIHASGFVPTELTWPSTWTDRRGRDRTPSIPSHELAGVVTADYCYLQDLFVADDARSGGVGRALIEHVYADANRRGASRVYWLTHESNHNAMRLYDRIADRSDFIQYRKQFA